MKIKESLKEFYNKEAKKYHDTRKKHRIEEDLILDEIKCYQDGLEKKGKIKILELGAGGGRFCSLLNNNDIKNIDYTGVDISEKLLEFAQKDNPKNKFICDDMSNYIQKKTKQEEFDFIVLTAAFQHIPTQKERIMLIRNFYRTLKYGGKVVMTNRSLSDWVMKHYRSEFIKSIFAYIWSFGRRSYKDILIPWKKGDEVHKRFYHFFDLKELENLAKLSGFVIQKLFYISKDGTQTSKRKNSRNSFLVLSKSVFLHETK